MAEDAPLPYRARALQVLLGVGAVLVDSGAAAVAGASGGSAARLPLAFLAVPLAAFSVHAARRGLRATEETLAACSAGLALVAAGWARGSTAAGIAAPAAVAVGLLLMAALVRTTAAWPVAAWVAAQLAALHATPALPASLHPTLFLSVSLAGLGVALFGRRLVARLALITTGPWWVAGVAGGTADAWTTTGAQRQLAAALLVAAAVGLLPIRLRRELDPFTGPRWLVPLVAGAVAGLGMAGAVAAVGIAGITGGGYAGILMATVLPEFLRGWRRLFRPAVVAAGGVLVGSALIELLGGQRWAALCLLLFLTAAPTVLVAVWRPGERAVAVPAALGCLIAGVLVTVPAGLLTAGAAAVVLTALFGSGLLVAAGLPANARRPTLVAAGAAAGVALALTAWFRDRDALAVVLALQGALTTGWGGWTAVPEAPASAAWRLGAVQLVVAAEIAAYDSGLRVLEAYTLPIAAGLLLGSGPALVRGPSWPAWGPGLLVAAVPSALLAVLAADRARPVVVLAVAAVAMVAAGAAGVRAPLMVGAGTAIAVALGLAVEALLWPLAGVLAVGAGLLVVGARREQLPLAWFSARLADLR
jgi:hypothetical protein